MAETRASVVVPLYNEARSIATLGERVAKVLDDEKLEWELVFVDDGSSDESYAEIEKLHRADPRYKCVRFARNFGAHVAASAGLENASGDVAIVMTADLEEPPELIPEFLAKWRDGNHVVWGIRATRVNRGLSALASKAFHRIFAWLADQKAGQSEIGGGIFLLDGRALETVKRFSERNRNLIGLLLWAGFKQARIRYEPASRKFGKSKWSLAKKIRLALDTFVGFSVRPLRLLLGGGFVCAFLGLAGLIAAGVCELRASTPATLYACIVSAALLTIGVQLIASGLLGEYLWRALDESRARPLYVVMDRLGVDDRVTQRAR